MKPKFSIVMPVASHDGNNTEYGGRVKMMNRAVRSIVNQQYPHWELIIVDDGSTDSAPEVIDDWAEKDERIRAIHIPSSNRAISRNAGMDSAQGDWICWLDSDDEYCSHYLREMDTITRDYPEYLIFNFGALIFLPDHRIQVREAFKPKIEGKGHEWFRAGGINTGSFIFSRELWQSDRKYRIPDEASPYAFAAESHFDMKFEPGRKEIEFKSEEAFTDGKMRVGLSLGNPWGDDFLQFYLLTRDNHSKPFDLPLYNIFPRSSEDMFEYF